MFGYTTEWADPHSRMYGVGYWDEDPGRMRSEITRYPWSSSTRSYDYPSYISPIDRPLFTPALQNNPYRSRDFLGLELAGLTQARWQYGTNTLDRHSYRSSFSSPRRPLQTTPSTYGFLNDRTTLNRYKPVSTEARRFSKYDFTSHPQLENRPIIPTMSAEASDIGREKNVPPIVPQEIDSTPSAEPAPEESANMGERGEVEGLEGKDVMISYSHQDKEEMRNIRQLLESSGISVWVDETGITPGSSFLNEIGGAVFHSSVFLIVLSLDSAKSRYCRGEISSAYISNKTIFVVALAPFMELYKAMDVGTRMVLHTLQWHFVNGIVDENKLLPLVKSIKTTLLSTGVATKSDHKGKEDGTDEENTNFIINEQAFLSINKPMHDDSLGQFDKDFWGAKFGQHTEVDWTRFVKVLDSSYEKLWKQLMISDQQKEQLIHRMSKEMVVDKEIVTFRQFKKFCTRGHDELPLSQAIRLYAAETYAMKGVFDVNSTVRLSAIANLRKFQSKAVIDSLLDILEAEEDPDVRVVAAMSLAHAASGIKEGLLKNRAEKSLMSCLDHPDRLVRESGCLALGRLKSAKSVPKLVQKWRNDVISTVREAAQIAINQIGGEEAEQAMHVTKILSEEISLLKKSPQ